MNDNIYAPLSQSYLLNDKEKNQKKIIIVNKSSPHTMYMVTHLIMSFFAIYLSWKCSNGTFNLYSFLLALFCPYLYIIYALAINGGCGIF